MKAVFGSMAFRRMFVHSFMLMLCVGILFLSHIDPAAAQSLQKLESAADRLVQFFTGKFGRSVGAMAFIGMFLAAAFGFWSWGALLRVGGALAGMFAAAELVGFLAGT